MSRYGLKISGRSAEADEDRLLSMVLVLLLVRLGTSVVRRIKGVRPVLELSLSFVRLGSEKRTRLLLLRVGVCGGVG